MVELCVDLNLPVVVILTSFLAHEIKTYKAKRTRKRSGRKFYSTLSLEESSFFLENEKRNNYIRQ